MPLGVKKTDFFTTPANLGEPNNLISKSFLTLDTTKYLEDLTLKGSLFAQFTDEAQKFDFRYNIKFDSQYDYAYTGNVSGKIINFPQGALHTDYMVDVFIFTDQAYFLETIPVDSNWSFTTIAGTNKGNKICHLVAVENVVTTGSGGEVTNFGTVLSEDYVTQPTEGYRFPRSYNVDPNHTAFNQLRFRSFGYDVAATIVALISLGEETYAEQYCLAMLKTQQRFQTDDGGNVTNQTNTDRMPFSSFLHNPQFLIDPYHRTGAEMWQAGAMLHFAKKFPSNGNTANILSRTNDFLRAMYNQEYVISSGLQNGTFRGGQGQYITSLDTENNQLVYLGFDSTIKVPWCANEHNVDAYFTLKEAESNVNFPDLWNALKRTTGSGWISASIEKQELSDMIISFEKGASNQNSYIAISPVAKSTVLDGLAVSVGGFSLILSTTESIFYSENGAGAINLGFSTVIGDKITLELNATDKKFRIYINDILKFTSNTFTPAFMNIHFGSNNIQTSLHKIIYDNKLLVNYVYDRNKPVINYDVINSNLTQNITNDLKTSVQSALQSPTQFYESTEKRGRRGISQDVFSGHTGISKNAGVDGWNGGGVSISRLTANSINSVEFEFDVDSTARACGFGIGNDSESITDIDYGWYLKSNNKLVVSENGSEKTVEEDYNAGDLVRIDIDTSNIIKYYHNGVLKYTSLITPTFPLLIDTAFFNISSIRKIKLNGNFVQFETGTSLKNAIPITESLSGELDNCHALDNMTWYAIARYDMGDITEPDACVDYVLNGGDGSYSNFDSFYSAIGLKTYIPNNGCYTTPVSTALMWTEGLTGYVMALKAKGDNLEAKTNLKEVAKISRIDGIPYVTRSDNIYELQDWGCIIASAWTVIANKPNGWWGQDYSQILTGNGL